MGSQGKVRFADEGKSHTKKKRAGSHDVAPVA